MNQQEMQLEDAKNDVKRLTGRTSEVPAVEESFKMARKERDAAMKSKARVLRPIGSST